MLDELRRAALVTSGLAELTKHRAEQLVRDLVKAGDLGKDQTAAAVKELVRRSAENRRELIALIRGELRAQIENLGLATRRDLDRLERRITRLEERTRTASRSRRKTTGTGSSTASRKKKTTSRKATRSTRTKEGGRDDG